MPTDRNRVSQLKSSPAGVVMLIQSLGIMVLIVVPVGVLVLLAAMIGDRGTLDAFVERSVRNDSLYFERYVNLSTDEAREKGDDFIADTAGVAAHTGSIQSNIVYLVSKILHLFRVHVVSLLFFRTYMALSSVCTLIFDL